MIRLAAAGIAALTAGPADPLAGRIAGAPRGCVAADRLTSPDVERGRIIYRSSDRHWWVTTPVDRCPSLQQGKTLIVEVNGAQLCRNDRFRLADATSIIASAPCRFGAFVPYDKPGR